MATAWLKKPEDHEFSELVFSDLRCPKDLVLKGREAGNFYAWGNESVPINWSTIIPDKEMPVSIASRGDLPQVLAKAIAERTIFDRPDAKYSVYLDEAKWQLALNQALVPEIAVILFDLGITNVLENPKAPLTLLLAACSDSELKKHDKKYAFRNAQLKESHLIELMGLSS